MKLRRDWILIFILGVILLFTIAPWLEQGVPATDDFRHHVTKFWWLEEQLTNEFSITEWQPHIYNGWPMAHFYHSLPYFVILPFAFILAPVALLKFNMVLAMLLAVLSMYVATKKFTNNTQTALLASIFYALAPLHFEFAYLSGSISRQWAFVLVPLALMSFIDLVNTKTPRSAILAALTYAATIWTHLNVAYALAVIFAVYLVFHISKDVLKKRSLEKQLLKQLAVFSILALALVSFWLIPLVLESGESEVTGRTKTVFGFAPAGLPLRSAFIRDFGIQNVNGNPFRYFYVGWSLLLLAGVGATIKNFEKKQTLLLIAATGLILTFFTAPLKLLPFVLVDYPIYFLMIALVPFCILAAQGARALSKLAPLPSLAVVLLLGIVVIDLYPALTTYNWIDQPTENFMNPQQLIDTWKFIGAQPSEFRVYSLVGEAPFMFHDKFEIGTTWMGYREGALKPIRQITDKLEERFRQNPTGPIVQQVLAYMGTQYLVLPCTQGLDQVYRIAFAKEGACAYNLKGAPLVSSITTVTHTDADIFKRGVNSSEAVVVEPCTSECSNEVEEARITNIKWSAKKIAFTTVANQSTQILIRSTYFKPHWHAYINSKETTIQEVWPKYTLIEIPKGEAKVEVVYKSNKTHLFANLITITAILACFWLLKKTKD